MKPEITRLARPFRRPKTQRALWSPTGGGDVADSPSHVDLKSHRDTAPRTQVTRIKEQAGIRSTLLAEGVRHA